MSNQEIFCMVELIGIEAKLNQRQLRSSGYVTRMDDSRLKELLFRAERSTGKGHKGEKCQGVFKLTPKA